MSKYLHQLLPLALLFATAPVHAQENNNLNASIAIQNQNLATTRELIKNTQNKNLDQLLSHFIDDAVFAQPFNPADADFAYRGKSEIGDGFQGIFGLIEKFGYDDQRYTVSNDGLTVFFEAQGNMAFAGTGNDYKNYYVFRVDFTKDGKVHKLTEYMNSLYLVTALKRNQAK